MKNVKIFCSIPVFITLLLGYTQSLGQPPARQTPGGAPPIARPAIQPPYTSLVPKFTFGKTLKEQEEQLKNNPLMLRFAEARKQAAIANPNRPIYHMTSAEGRLGDPNGLAFWQGRWHMFYQGFPPDDGRQHWGHVVSDDLVHWRDLPYAIYPNPERAVFSGSALVEDNRVIAMYHGAGLGNIAAVSDDPLLLNWEKKLKNGLPTISTKSPDGTSLLPYVVFDPSIWKRDGTYYALAGGKRAPETAAIGRQPQAMAYLFKSKDLVNWDYLHEFVEGDRYTMIGDDYACPYFWPIGDRYIMNFFSHMSGGQFLLGDYDKAKDKFTATSGSGPSGLGPPSSTPDGKGGVVVVYTVGGVLAIPRKLTLLGRDEIGQEPAADFSSLHYNPKHIGTTPLPANKEVVLNGISGNTMEISAEIAPGNAQTIELNVLRSPNKEEYTRIIIFRGKGYNGTGQVYVQGPGTALVPIGMLPGLLGTPRPAAPPAPAPMTQSSLLTIDPSYSSLTGTFRGVYTVPFNLNQNDPIKLRVFIDKGLVEVFVNGKQALSLSVSPSRDDSVGVSLRAQGQDAELKMLDAWQMKGIY